MTKKYLFCIILLHWFFFFTGGCYKTERTKRPRDALVCVDGECLTERDVEYQIPDAYRATVRPEEKKEYVRRWVRNEILYQQAKKERLDQDKKVQSLVEERIKETVVTQFIEGKLKDKIRVTDEEALGYYQQHREEFVWDDDVLHLAHIFTQKIAGATLADLMLKQGNKFEDLVRKLSEDETTNKRGGDLGFVRIKDISPELLPYVLKLKPNEISPPIQTYYGFEIIRVMDRKQKGQPMEFEWAKRQIMNALVLERRQMELDKLYTQLLEKARIEKFGWATDVKPEETK